MCEKSTLKHENQFFSQNNKQVSQQHDRNLIRTQLNEQSKMNISSRLSAI